MIRGMTTKQLSKINNLAKIAQNAAKRAMHSRFVIETLLSHEEARVGKVTKHASAASLIRTTI